MEKSNVKELICQAIDNIPDIAEIKDCFVEHSYMSDHATINIKIEVKDKTEDSIIAFHNKAHSGFDSGLDVES